MLVNWKWPKHACQIWQLITIHYAISNQYYQFVMVLTSCIIEGFHVTPKTPTLVSFYAYKACKKKTNVDAALNVYRVLTARVSLEANWRGFDAFFWKLDSNKLAKLNFKTPFLSKSESKSEHSWLKVLQKLNYLLYQQTSHTHKKKNKSVISKFIFSIYCEICCIKNYQ